MRTRFTVLVLSKGSERTARTFGNYEYMTDAERLAARINKLLANGYNALVIPSYPATSAKAAVAALPSYFAAGE